MCDLNAYTYKLIRTATVGKSLDGILKGQLQFLNNHFDVIGVSSGKDRLRKIEKREGIICVSIQMNRGISVFKDIVSLYKLILLFYKESPFIVHSITPKAGFLSMVSAYFARVPHRLHTVAGLPLLEETGVKRKLLDIIEKITYACSTRLYPNSNGLKEIIIRNKYTKSSKLTVLGNGSSNGINTEHFNSELFTRSQKLTLRKKIGVRPKDTVFIFVGRLVKDKGINELVQVFTMQFSVNPYIKLILVGRLEKTLNQLLPATTKLIIEHPGICWVGVQEDVRPYLSIGDIFVFPSYREGFPNAVMQAGAMDLPSIVTDINGCNEIIKHDVNGVIIPPKDTEALNLAMLDLHINIEKRRKLASNSRQMIIDRYEQSYVWGEILKMYQSLERK